MKAMLTILTLAMTFQVSADSLIVMAPEADMASKLEQINQNEQITLEYDRDLGLDRIRITVVQGDRASASAALEQQGFSHVETDQFLPTPERRAVPVEARAGQLQSRALDLNQFNDPLFVSQTFLDDSGRSNRGASGIMALRSSLTGSEGKVRIAVLDSGSLPHKDVQWSNDAANMVAFGSYCSLMSPNGGDETCASNYISTRQRSNDATDKQWLGPDRNGNYAIAIDGHGLAVASHIGATTNNGRGLVGIVPHNQVELVPVRVLSYHGGLSSDLADGILWAIGEYPHSDISPISEPVDIINMSLAGNVGFSCAEDSYLYAAMEKAREKGVLLVAAAGNDSNDAALYSPGHCPDVINVASVTETGMLSWFSNYGEAIEFGVTGENIAGAYLNTGIYDGTSEFRSYCPDDGADCYANFSGTSMASPVTAGILALLMLNHPDENPYSLVGAAIATAKGTTGQEDGELTTAAKMGIGHGIIDAQATMAYLDEGTLPPVTAEYRYPSVSSPVDLLALEVVGQYVADPCNMVSVRAGHLDQAVPSVRYQGVTHHADGSQSNFSTSNPDIGVNRSLVASMEVSVCNGTECGENQPVPLPPARTCS